MFTGQLICICSVKSVFIIVITNADFYFSVSMPNFSKVFFFKEKKMSLAEKGSDV